MDVLLHKRGCSEDNNYKFSKKKAKLTDTNQYGILENSITEVSARYVIENINQRLEKGKYGMDVSVNFKKAFNSVNLFFLEFVLEKKFVYKFICSCR